MFPTLIRKTEAKHIRTFLTTGTQDMENCAGNWTLLDMEMDKALKFSGYDYRFKVLEGGHVVGWKECFAEGMHFFSLHVEDWDDNAGAESLCYDREGHLYVATRCGIQVCVWDGPT